MAYIGKSPTGSAVRSRYYFTATGGETSLSGADDNGKTLKFTDGEYVDVHLNGIMLVQGTDYGVGTANTISSLSALAANDIVEIVVYDVYNVAKINSEAMRNRWYFTATGGETSISTSQISNLVFPANAEIDVKLNGVTLQAGTDYNTTTANTVGGLSALTAGQVVEIVYYEKFVLGDTVSKASGGTFANAVTVNGKLTVNSPLVDVGKGDGTGDARIQFISDSTQGSGWIGVPTWADDHLYLYGPNAAGGNEAVMDYDGTNEITSFYTGGTERLRIQSGGGISFNGDTAAANALGDYEEGTWTPTDNSGAGLTFYAVYSASYTRIGDTVYVSAYFQYPSTTNTSNTVVGGLPYTAENTSNLYHSLCLGYKSSTNPSAALITPNTNQFDFRSESGAILGNDDMSSVAVILSGVYKV